MNVFKIKICSISTYFFTTTIIIFSGMALGIYMALIHANDVYFFPLFLFGLLALVFIPDLVSTATTEWSMNEKEVEIKWLSQSLFQNKRDATIGWENVEEYVFQPQRTFSFLKLKLRDSTVLKYWHCNTTIEDDFNRFVTDFQKRVSEFNEEGINILHPIQRKKNIYETKRCIALAIFSALIMMLFPILIASHPERKVDWIYIIPGYSGSIYFISQVIAHNRKKKQQRT